VHPGTEDRLFPVAGNNYQDIWCFILQRKARLRCASPRWQDLVVSEVSGICEEHFALSSGFSGVWEPNSEDVQWLQQ
jgi:hypothetical protein